MVTRVRPAFDWVQFAALLLSMVSIALYNEGRLSRIEQRQIDAEKEHAALVQQLKDLETKWEHSPHPCNSSPTTQ